jgi:amino acid transporter
MGVVCAIGTFFTLTTVISVMLAVFVIVQGIAQVVALTVLRRNRPDLERPYKMWLYPIPSVIALAGWAYIYVSAGRTPIVFSIVVIAVGTLAFLVWARAERSWPFARAPQASGAV